MIYLFTLISKHNYFRTDKKLLKIRFKNTNIFNFLRFFGEQMGTFWRVVFDTIKVITTIAMFVLADVCPQLVLFWHKRLSRN